jgi:hypothetical protein
MQAGKQQDQGLWKRVAATLAVVATIAVYAMLEAQDREQAAKEALESLERTAYRPAELCIKQYAAAERWTSHQRVYECASGWMNPPHVLSSPVAQR